jgi:adenine-specific DNA-methyltransferase
VTQTDPSKLKMHTPDLVSANIAWVAERFPGCITESRDEHGELVRAVDFDLLRQELSGELVEGPQERYHLNWPGKREALLAANAPIAKTLRPCRKESVDFDTTRNLFIEGDNLDALKLLQETYLNKVKMIYIDPPYNTGGDLVYEDDYADTTADFLLRSQQVDDLGQRLVANTDSNGRFHSDWLTMIYPRLKLARTLLRDDGFLFVSIDDIEAARLRAVLDEVFGADNFVEQVVLKSKAGAGAKPKAFITVHEYVLVYARDASRLGSLSVPMTEDQRKMYSKRDDKHATRGPYGTWALATTSMGDRPNLRFPIHWQGEEIWPEKQWLWSKDRVEAALASDELVFNKKRDGTWSVRFKRYLRDEDGSLNLGTPTSFMDGPYTHQGTKEIKELFGERVFSFPKPTALVRHLLGIAASTRAVDDPFIVMDFFAGSGTTGHAVMDFIAEALMPCQFILTQIPEPVAESSEAAKFGLLTIADIGKERLRRVRTSLRQDPQLGEEEHDLGFRVLRVDSSNMKDVYYRPGDATPALLGGQVDNIKDDRSDEDLLFQVLLDWGVDLSLPIAKEAIAGKAVYFVDGNALAACFATGVDDAFVKELAKREPMRAVFRDAGYASDDVKINVRELFKQLSPGTEVRTL